MNCPFGLHHNGMHDWIMDEFELGARVAHALDAEACGFGPLVDLQLLEHLRDEDESRGSL